MRIRELLWDDETVEHLAEHGVHPEEVEQVMKSHIPKFKSLEQERRFWQTHDVTEFWTELTPVKLTFTKPRRSKSVSVKLTGLEARILQNVLARLSGTRPRHTLNPRKS